MLLLCPLFFFPAPCSVFHLHLLPSGQDSYLTHLFLFLRFLLIYLFLAALGLHCWARLSLVAVSWGYSLVAVCRLLVAVVSLVAEHRLWGTDFNSCDHGLGRCRSQVEERRLSGKKESTFQSHRSRARTGPRIRPCQAFLSHRRSWRCWSRVSLGRMTGDGLRRRGRPKHTALRAKLMRRNVL